jgi:hypothetical protein
MFHSENYLRIETFKTIFLTATIKTTDESLRSYTPEQRRCYFEGERKLQFFASYTKAQCEIECLTNKTLEKCGCVRFSMPREEGTKVCNIDELKCATNQFFELIKNIGSCGCLKPCNDIEYKIVNEKNSEIDYVSTPGLASLRKRLADRG